MKKTLLAAVSMLLLYGQAFAADGQILINQATVIATGGFPYKITQPGSYKLSGNLTPPDANTNGINVTADNVTIDMNGFSIIGPCATAAACPLTSGVGVSSASENSCSSAGPVSASGFKNVSVMNGTIRGTGAGGIRIGAYGNVENMTVLSSGRFGIATGDFGTIRNNRVFDTRQDNLCSFVVGAVVLGGGSIASGNTVGGNYIGFFPFGGQGGLATASVLLIGNAAPGPFPGNAGPEANTFPGINLGEAVLINNLGF